MKKSDIITIAIWAAVICSFAFIPGAWDWFNETTKNHGLLMSFFKFAILGTFGEMLSLRIKEGVYYKEGFGLLPKMLVLTFFLLMRLYLFWITGIVELF